MSNEWRDPILAEAADVHEPAANTAAVVTLAAETNTVHVLHAAHGGYDAAPTAGKLLTIAIGGSTVRAIPVAVAGPFSIKFPRGLRGTKNQALVVTLAAGGAGITGKVSIDKVSVKYT